LNLDWLAGFFDGEGTITVSTSTATAMRHGIQIRPTIALSQSNKRAFIITHVQQELGFGITYPNIEEHKLVWQVFNKQDLERFVGIFKNRLVIKKSQIDLLDEILQRMKRREHLNDTTRPHIISLIKKLRGYNGVAKNVNTLNLR